MTTDFLSVSTRSVLNRWFLALVLVMFALALVGSVLTISTYTGEAETVTEERTTGTATIDSEFNHASTVQRGTEVFTPGERLENRRLYFTTVSPILDGTHTLSYNTTGDESATATIELALLIRAVEESNEEEIVYWETRDSLETRENVDLQDGGEVSTTVSTNVSRVLDRVNTIEDELGASPGETEVLLIADTTVEGTVDNQPFTDTRTDRIAIRPADAVYRTSTAIEEQKSYRATTQVTRTVQPSALSLYGGPLLLLVGLAGVAGLGVARRRSWLTVTERERARSELTTTRTDFEEWFSNFEIPESGDRTVVQADTLADLVDVAIDSGRRVLEDGNQYAVIVDDVMYTYRATEAADAPADPPETDTASDSLVDEVADASQKQSSPAKSDSNPTTQQSDVYENDS